jgi:cell division protein FtsB
MGRVRRFLLPSLVGLALYYAVFGGEYSLFELRNARAEIEAREREVAALNRTLDSLRAWVDSLQNDSATLERLAREKFGMIRDGEILYRLAEPPESGRDTTR